MSTTDYTAINPALLSPAQLVTRRMQMRAKEHAFPTQSSNSDDDELPTNIPINPLTESTNQIGQRRLPDFVDSLKRKFGLQPQACAELDELIAVCLLAVSTPSLSRAFLRLLQRSGCCFRLQFY